MTSTRDEHAAFLRHRWDAAAVKAGPVVRVSEQIRCTQLGPHDQHEDSHTGLTWEARP